MRFLNFCPYYPPHIGGLEKHAKELHEHFAKRGIHVTVFTPNIPQIKKLAEKHKNIQIIRYPAFEVITGFPLPKFWNLQFWSLYKRLFIEDYTVVFSITRFFHSPLLALVYAKIKHKKWIHIEHGSDFTRGDNFIVTVFSRLYDETFGRLALVLSDKNITPSKSAAKFVSYFTKKPSAVIYRGMPFSQIDAIIPNKSLKQKYTDKKIITYAGRFLSGKGVADLVKAISKISTKDVILFLVGDGPEKKHLQTLVQEYHLEKRVVFLGMKSFDEVISILKITDIFVNPSYNEGLPTTVLEAAACACGIVATDVGGTQEVIKHNISGFLPASRSPEEITKYLDIFLQDEQKRQSFGKLARADIENRFNWNQSINQYITEINNVSQK